MYAYVIYFVLLTQRFTIFLLKNPGRDADYEMFRVRIP